MSPNTRLLRLDEVVSVRVPTESQEAARDLVRAREAARADLMRARHRLSKLLLRHGIVYSGGKAWTVAHDGWLARQHFERFGTQAASPVELAACGATRPEAMSSPVHQDDSGRHSILDSGKAPAEHTVLR